MHTPRGKCAYTNSTEFFLFELLRRGNVRRIKYFIFEEPNSKMALKYVCKKL